MLVLRLVRTGRRNQPKFRLVAAEQGEKLNGNVVEILGHYEPAAPDKPFVFDKEKVQGWLAKGGVPSNTVAKLLNMNGFDLPVHIRPEARPRKKTQARIEAANKPSSVAEDVEDKVEAPVATETAPVTGLAEETVVEVPTTEEPAAETAPIDEETPTEAPTETNESN